MNISRFRQILKTWMLPIAMVIGMLFHSLVEKMQPITPYLIFVMLFVTYCKVNWSHFRLGALSWSLLAVQILGALAVYFALLPLGHQVAQGAFICVFCPTATAAPVITGMLGGSIARVAIFTILSNLTVAVSAPLLFEYMSGTPISDFVAFTDGFVKILAKVGPLLLLPLAAAYLVSRFLPRVHGEIAKRQSWSFYLWCVALITVIGRSVSFAMQEPADRIPEMALLSACALVVCCIQFFIGRRVGRRYGDRVAGAQSLMQKNTILAIWMMLTFFDPITSIAPASYVLWQNTINSIQVYLHNRKQK